MEYQCGQSSNVGRRVRITDPDSARPVGVEGIIIDYDANDEYQPYLINWSDARHDHGTWTRCNYYEFSPDAVSHPAHYTSHPSGVECMDIVKHMNFPLGNVIKYVWRADLKADGVNALEDLEKARTYLEVEIERRKALNAA